VQVKHARQLLFSDESHDIGDVLRHQLADSMRLQRRTRRKAVHNIVQVQKLQAEQAALRSHDLNTTHDMLRHDASYSKLHCSGQVAPQKSDFGYHFNPLSKQYNLGSSWRSIVEDAIMGQIIASKAMLEERKALETCTPPLVPHTPQVSQFRPQRPQTDPLHASGTGVSQRPLSSPNFSRSRGTNSAQRGMPTFRRRNVSELRKQFNNDDSSDEGSLG
jgi:hypothetical protein